MATITEKEIIDRVIARGGRYEDDPPAIAIYKFLTDRGRTCWSVCYSAADIRSTPTSSFVRNPRLIWPESLMPLSNTQIEFLNQLQPDVVDYILSNRKS